MDAASRWVMSSNGLYEEMFPSSDQKSMRGSGYDRLATNFLAAVCLAATVSYWL